MALPGDAPGRDRLEAALRGDPAGLPPPPFFSILNLRFAAVSDGTATFEMPISTDHYNPNGVVHGGAIASLADSAMGFAVYSTLAAGESFTTAEIHMNFLKAASVESGILQSTGRVIQRGRQIAVATAEVFDSRGQLIATASSTNLVWAPRPEPIAPAEPPVATPGATPTPAPAPLARTKGRIRTHAGDIAYLRQGQGPPLLLLHGIPTSSYLWRDVIEPLAATFEVLAPDLLGYGDSDKRLDADLSIAAQARYMVAFMESLGVHQAAVVGHDIGGGVAQLMAVDEPDRVARLILIDSIVDNNWPIPDIARLKEPAWDQILVDRDLRPGFREGLTAGTTSQGIVTEELVNEIARPFSDQGTRRAYLRAARALNSRDLVSRSKHIQEIQTPTLILWGANDRFLDPRWAEVLQRKLVDATVEIIDPGGHFLPLDRPEAVATAITKFLTSR
ncbi:MAG: alpha/beta fold hydrolase [Candidatus Dormibacteraeota bacterium]|nr:alpha/beta fold hydrolase [Candidatus Dormibacteraeota bacterium]